MKKILILFLLVSSLIFFQYSPAQAASNISAKTQVAEDIATEMDPASPPSLGSFSRNHLTRNELGTTIDIIGSKLLMTSDASKRYNAYFGEGLLPASIQLTASLYNRPVNTATYVADVLHNTGIVKQAYAQGIGFSGLNPVLSVWKAFRNMAYFAYIIVFVIIGFMIMLRKKISSNAVATIQEVLPKLIVTLILITFSYAIAGFMVDLMYFSIYLIVAIFAQVGLITDSNLASGVLFNRNIIGIGISFLTGVTEPAGVAAESMGNLVAQVIGGFMGAAANVLFYLIFAVAVLIAVFKTFIQLVTAYIGIILSTIFAPVQILPNAFPGSDAFQKWLRGLLANVAVFPTAATMVLLGVILSGTNAPVITGTENAQTAFGISPTSNPATFDYDGFLPPLIYGKDAADGGSVSAVKGLIGFGIIMLLPEVVKMVKKTLEVKDEPYGETAWKSAMAGKEHGPAAWVGSGAKYVGGIATGAVTQATGTILGGRISQLPFMHKLNESSLEAESSRAADVEDRKLQKMRAMRAARNQQSIPTQIPVAPTPTSSSTSQTGGVLNQKPKP